MKNFLIFSLLLSLAVPAFAVATRVHSVDNYTDFLKGSRTNVSVASDGSIAPGIESDSLELPVESLWSVYFDGHLTYIGSGNNGILFKIKDGEIERVYHSDDVIVSNIFRLGDNVYATTIPEGKIFRIEGDSLTLVASTRGYPIWTSYVFKQTAWLGTGPEGTLFSFDGEKLQVVSSLPGESIISIDSDESFLYLGMSRNGTVFRLDPVSGSLVALFQFEENEIKELVLDGSNLRVVANGISGQRPVPTSSDNSAANKALLKFIQALQSMNSESGDAQSVFEDTITVDQDAQSESSEQAASKQAQQPARVSGGAVYTLDLLTNKVDKTLFIPNESILSLSLEKSGSFVIGTEPNGKIYRVFPEQKKFTLLRSEISGSIMKLGVGEDGDIGFAITGEPAIFHSYQKADPNRSSYTSQVYDLTGSSRLGRFVVSPGSGATILVRTGDVGEPDATWSSWQEITSDKPLLENPFARYCQFRIHWTKPVPLDYIRFYYIGQNHKPSIRQLTVDGSEGSSNGDVNEATRSPFVKISWNAEDPDNDKLIYSLSVISVDKGVVVPLDGADRVSSSFYTLKTDLLDDGRYRILLQASDSPDNPPEEVLSVSRESGIFLIDNTPPLVTVNRVAERGGVTVSASDSVSPISSILYSINAGEWVPCAAKDGLFDSKNEETVISPGEDATAITVKAIDAAGNWSNKLIPVKSR